MAMNFGQQYFQINEKGSMDIFFEVLNDMFEKSEVYIDNMPFYKFGEKGIEFEFSIIMNPIEVGNIVTNLVIDTKFEMQSMNFVKRDEETGMIEYTFKMVNR